MTITKDIYNAARAYQNSTVYQCPPLMLMRVLGARAQALWLLSLCGANAAARALALDSRDAMEEAESPNPAVEAGKLIRRWTESGRARDGAALVRARARALGLE